MIVIAVDKSSSFISSDEEHPGGVHFHNSVMTKAKQIHSASIFLRSIVFGLFFFFAYLARL